MLMAAADAPLDAVQTAAACDAVTPIYQDLVHDTLCRKFVRSLNAMGVSHAVVGVALYVFLYAANYVSETILLAAERRDMKAQVGGERSLLGHAVSLDEWAGRAAVGPPHSRRATVAGLETSAGGGRRRPQSPAPAARRAAQRRAALGRGAGP